MRYDIKTSMEATPRNQEKKEAPHQEITTQMEDGKDQLENERAIRIDIHLSPTEREALERVRVENEPPQFDAFGNSSTELKEQLMKYFEQMGENDEKDLEEIANVVTRLSEGVREGFGEEAVWTMVRVTLPNDEFELPRWHSDGEYFRSSGKHYKLVATLKGEETLFGDVSDPESAAQLRTEESENYERNKSDSEKFDKEDLRIRKEMAKVVTPKEIGGDGKAVIYLVGNKGAVFHSEPNITKPRIFVSVLAGSEEQIAEWQSRMGN